MHILLLQDRADVREKASFFLESTYGAKVEECSTIGEGLECLKNSKSSINLIILDSKEGSPEELEKFWGFIAEIPMLLCVQGSPEGASNRGKVIGVIERSSFIDSVVSTINNLIVQGTLQQDTADQGQVRIKTKLLLTVCPLKGDIYIRLSKDKFVKLFREGDVFDLADLEKYTIKKGVEYLYIRKEQCAEFAEKYKLELQKLLASENLSVEEVSKLGTSIHEAVQEIATQVGFNKEVQELTKTHVQLTVKAMGKDPDLAEILNKLKESEGQYIASHSNLCAYLACAIAAQIQWGSDTTFYKLSLASFLHDITLTNHELAAINTLEELEKDKKKFTEAEIKDFKNHPAVAAEMAKKMTEVPPDVDTIIRQHHERPDGSGFPRGLGHAYIAPLASVFIVAHDLTQYVLNAGDKFNAEEFLSKFRDKYKSSQFKKVLGCIEMLQKIKTLSASMRQNQKS